MTTDREAKTEVARTTIDERPLDLWLIGAIFVLLLIGTLEIYSASAPGAIKHHDDGMFFLKRQLVWLALGGLAMWVATRIDVRMLKRFAYPLLLTSLALLVGVLAFGQTINGATRWFSLGPISFQPVELCKLALIIYLATSLGKKADRIKVFAVGFVPHLLVCALMTALLLAQPDLGSSIVLAATTLVMLFVAGTRISYLALAVLAAAPVAYHMVVGSPWRMKRFLAYFNPEAYSQGVAYQIVQARIGIGSGGAFGAGLGGGRQQLGYMPEGHNDFIMAAIGEELGFVGFALVLALFAVIVWRGIRAAVGARDAFSSYLAFGLTVLLALQALINVGVVLGTLPAKGITLPFVSYGGSSLLASMFFGGLLVNIARRRSPSVQKRRELVNVVGGRKKKRRAIVIV